MNHANQIDAFETPSEAPSEKLVTLNTTISALDEFSNTRFIVLHVAKRLFWAFDSDRDIDDFLKDIQDLDMYLIVPIEDFYQCKRETRISRIPVEF